MGQSLHRLYGGKTNNPATIRLTDCRWRAADYLTARSGQSGADCVRKRVKFEDRHKRRICESREQRSGLRVKARDSGRGGRGRKKRAHSHKARGEITRGCVYNDFVLRTCVSRGSSRTPDACSPAPTRAVENFHGGFSQLRRVRHARLLARLWRARERVHSHRTPGNPSAGLSSSINSAHPLLKPVHRCCICPS